MRACERACAHASVHVRAGVRACVHLPFLVLCFTTHPTVLHYTPDCNLVKLEGIYGEIQNFKLDGDA